MFNPLFTGLAAAQEADRQLRGAAQALPEYLQIIRGIEANYRRQFALCYAAETRWAEASPQHRSRRRCGEKDLLHSKIYIRTGLVMNSTSIDSVHTYRGTRVSESETVKQTALDALNNQLIHNRNSPFLTADSGMGNTLTLSYDEFDTYTKRAMTWLWHELGLRPGDVLGISPRNNLPSVIAIFGALRLGAKVALVSPDDPPLRQQAICGSVGTRAFLDTPPMIASLPRPEVADAELNPAADAFYFGTSGSTSTSKIVAQTLRGAASNALALQRHLSIKAGLRLLGCLPIHHVNCFHFTILCTLYCGAHAVLLNRFDPFGYTRVLEKTRPHIASVVPSILKALLVTWRTPRIPDELKCFVSAAAPLSRQTARLVHDRWGVRILQGYGLTETVNFSTMMPENLSDEVYRRQILDVDVPSIGVAIEGNEVTILDAEGRRVTRGREGEICVRGYNVMDRYVGNPEATEEAFKHGWFHTGDLGVVREDAGAEFFAITGRIKNVAKVRGESVSLEEMERVLLELDGIADAACATIDNPMQGESLIAIVNARPDVTDDLIFDHLCKFFAESVLPSRVARSSNIPRSGTGKIIRPELRKYVDSLF